MRQGKTCLSLINKSGQEMKHNGIKKIVQEIDAICRSNDNIDIVIDRAKVYLLNFSEVHYFGKQAAGMEFYSRLIFIFKKVPIVKRKLLAALPEYKEAIKEHDKFVKLLDDNKLRINKASRVKQPIKKEIEYWKHKYKVENIIRQMYYGMISVKVENLKRENKTKEFEEIIKHPVISKYYKLFLDTPAALDILLDYIIDREIKHQKRFLIDLVKENPKYVPLIKKFINYNYTIMDNTNYIRTLLEKKYKENKIKKEVTKHFKIKDFTH